MAIELLAPAGSKESFISSINAGANAVYLGGKSFSARAYASNFTNEELEKMIIYAHKRNVKVYITVNTLIFENEIEEVIDFISFLHSRNVDGILLQDLGVASLVHKKFPNLVIHASTQLNCHNVSEAKALIELGFKRIVVARETPLEIIRKIKELGVEVEVFIHGALCVSYSGNCLMSSLIGNRSGNRGKCAQPCRNYMVCKNNLNEESNKFAISMRDLCSLDNIDKLIESDIDSLKIEGRMKREEYVYEVVSSYRKAIDAYYSKVKVDSNLLITNMGKLFNREFTKGFIFNESRTKTLNQRTSSHIGTHLGKVVDIRNNYCFIKLDDEISVGDGIRINNHLQDGQVVQKMFKNNLDVKEAYKGDTIKLLMHNIKARINDEVIKTTSIKQIKGIDELIKNDKKIEIDVSLYAYINSPLKMIIKYKDLEILKESSYIVEKANNEIDRNKLYNQINRLGNTEYSIKSLSYYGDNDSFIPSSILNELRRISLEELDLKIDDLFKINENIVVNEYKMDVHSFNHPLTLSVQVENEEQLLSVMSYPYNKIFINNKDLYMKYKDDERIYLSLLRVNENDIEEGKDKEVIPYIKNIDKGVNVISSPYLNATNSYSLDYLYSKGVKEVILSYELSKNSIKEMMDNYYKRNNSYPLVALPLYGYIDLMIMKSCPISTMHHINKDHCNMCKKNHYVLEDRLHKEFDMMHDENCTTRILNSLPLYLLDFISEIEELNISEGILYFTKENKDEVDRITNDAFNKLYTRDNNVILEESTRGHYLKETA